MQRNEIASDLGQKSRLLQRQATGLLAWISFPRLLEPYGTLESVGAYALQLMLKPDLDLELKSDRQDSLTIRLITSTLVGTKKFQSIVYRDMTKRGPGKFISVNGEVPPKGHYWYLTTEYKDTIWQIDLWLVKHSEQFFDQPIARYKKLLASSSSKNLRTLILELKNHFWEGRQYQDKVNGSMIYDAVLDKKVDSLLSFQAYLQSRDEI